MSVDLMLGHTPMLMLAGRAKGLLRNELAYVLATGLWETAWTMEPVIEAYWLSEEWRADNLDYYPWYGRGFVQLTWKENYERADSKLGLGGSLLDNPDRALEPFIAARVIVLGMQEGWFTGHQLGDYIDLQHSDFEGARAIVNPTDHAEDIARIAEDYDQALQAVGYGEQWDVPIGRPLAVRVSRLEEWAAGYGV
ncbi:carboxypeptidase [Paracoccus sp. MBLB3053]|uniref:Carboxypeptidase n=1 Tax=Paracoccus aurantius TaxID=3073814 RepID=A0ABU2I0A0_9RHOB|nr:carboxypeptidase [Paracoccus sp. MBLB3053]MDS9470289.1 carboxypeptidase [Paracoccus sp. MBLB3053]